MNHKCNHIQFSIHNLPIRIFRSFKKAIFPSKCLQCGSFFHEEEEPTNKLFFSGRSTDLNFDLLMHSYLCRECINGIIFITSPICSKCGTMFKTREGEDHLCGDCIRFPKRFTAARSFAVYENTFMGVIHRFKYKGKIQLAYPLGMLLLMIFLKNWDFSMFDLIIPVPLHEKRLRERGYNPAHLLVKDWVSQISEMNLDASIPSIDICSLKRTKWTVPQTGLRKEERMKNIKNAFCLDDPIKIEDKRILLVDDVYTTGATVDECTKVLLKGGGPVEWMC